MTVVVQEVLLKLTLVHNLHRVRPYLSCGYLVPQSRCLRLSYNRMFIVSLALCGRNGLWRLLLL